MRAVLTVLLTVGPTIAWACSPPPSWEETGFFVLGDEAWRQEAARIPVFDPERLVLTTHPFQLPHFDDFAHRVVVQVEAADGAVIEGQLYPTRQRAHIRWVPDTPLVVGEIYTVTIEVVDSWRPEPRVVEVEVQADGSEPGEGVFEVEAERGERRILGPCDGEEVDLCGFAECDGERPVLEVEQRVELRFRADVAETAWPAARAMRVAAGVTAAEAEAILDRTPYGTVGDRKIDVAAYRTWPTDEVCGAIEVVAVDGTELLRGVSCVPVVAHADLGRDIQARLDREAGREPETVGEPREPGPDPLQAESSNGGCDSADGVASLWGAVLILALRRRRQV